MDKLERIKNLIEINAQMETLKREAINHDSKKELADARYKKIKQIQNELQEIADTLQNEYLRIEKIPVHIYWLNVNSSDRRYPEIIFNKGKVTLEEWSLASSLRWENMTNISKEKIYEYNKDDEINKDWIRLLKNWDTIKSYIEEEIEKALMEKIRTSQTQVMTFKKKYEEEVL